MTKKSDQARLVELKKAFKRIGGEDGLIDQEEFQGALGIVDQYFAARIFSLFDRDDNGMIDQQEFLHEVERLVSGTAHQKLRFAFRLHDADGGGYIEQHELAQLINASLVENQFEFSPEQTESLVRVLFREADTDHNGEISFKEFKGVVAKYPDLLESMTVSPVSWLTPRTVEQAQERAELPQAPANLWRVLSNRRSQLFFLGLYVLTNLLLFFQAAWREDATIYLQLIRGTGAMLYFNGALILVPMMRSLLTWLRKTPLSDYLPIDERIEFHKLVGQVMFATALLHAIAHFFNYTTQPLPFILSLFATRIDLSGFLLLLVFSMMWLTAQTPIRKGGYFRLFYLTHTLYVLWFILALIHAPNFWQWLIVPLIGFAVERLIRYRKYKEPTVISNAQLLPGRVLALEIERPANFNYQPGDYLYLKCPVISGFEWHPFIISSAPEEKESLSVHIRAIGSWTGALYDLFLKEQASLQANAQKERLKVPVYLDGPYGTPTHHIFSSQVVVLISAGIGVTAFISILKSILARKQQAERADSRLEIEKVYFFWLNQGQSSFQWLLGLLKEIEAKDSDNQFELNIYLTDAEQASDMKSSSLFIALDLLHEKTQVDLFTGLRTQTKTGQPDWTAIFGQIAETHSNQQVNVYYCGPLTLSRTLKRQCDQFEFGYRKENF